MDNSEARHLLVEFLAGYRQRSYDDLVGILKKDENTELVGASGTKYQITVQVFWDRQPQGNIRVRGAIDDGGWRAFKPLIEDFIRAPSGAFVGE